MKLKRRRKKKKPGLMLTSLLDMFTIILIFLIVSFDSENQEFELNTDLTLPESTAKQPFKAAANMAITPNAVLVENIPIVRLSKGQPIAGEYDEEALVIPRLKDALERILAVRVSRESGDEEEDDENIVMLQADRRLEYRTLYLVMSTARSASVGEGEDAVFFDKFRLTVMKK